MINPSSGDNLTPVNRLKTTIIGCHSLALMLSMGTAQAAIEWQNVWVRAMPPTQQMTAAYGTISNRGTTSVTLKGVSADFATRAELHRSVQQGNAVRMIPMGLVELAPGESLILKPGGAHLMLMGIDSMPAPDTSVALCATTTSDSVCTMARVLRRAPKSPHDGHSEHMSH